MTEDLGGEAPCLAPFFHLDGEVTGPVASALLVDLADAVVIANPEGRIVFWNRAAERLFGWPADDALDRTLDLIIPEKHRQRHWDGYRAVMASGESQYSTQLLEVPALRSDGSRLSISFTVTLIRDDRGVAGVAAVIRDETERRQRQRRLEQRVSLLTRPGTLPL